MQPNSPQPGFPQYGPQLMVGGPASWGGGPSPLAVPPKPRANAAASVIAGILALLTAGMLVWFALYNVVYATGPTGRWSSLVAVNVLGGVIGAGLLLVPAGFTFARMIFGAWALCALCLLYVGAVVVTAPLLWGTAFRDQLKFVFSFDGSDGVAIGLAVIFGVLTAIVAAIAGSVRSYVPTSHATRHLFDRPQPGTPRSPGPV